MRTARWRWLASITAALLLVSSAVPTSSGTPPAGVAAAVAVHDRAAQDRAVRPGIADRLDRATPVERMRATPVERMPGTPPESVPVAGVDATTSTARPGHGAIAAAGPSAASPRAPPHRTAPIPS